MAYDSFGTSDGFGTSYNLYTQPQSVANFPVSNVANPSYNLYTQPEAVANLDQSVPTTAVANPFITGSLVASPEVAPALGGASAAEAYRQLGPEATPEERQAAMQAYRDAIRAPEMERLATMPQQMAAWRNQMDNTSRYDEWFKTHVAKPYNDPSKIGNAQLYTDESGQRRMEMPSLLQEEEAQNAIDDANRQYGDIRRAAIRVRKKDPVLAAKLNQQALEFQRREGVGGNRDTLVANQLARGMEDQSQFADVRRRFEEQTKEQIEAARERMDKDREEGIRRRREIQPYG
jgi:hypothetical protein